MTSPHAQLALWVVQPVILAAVSALMYRRKLHKEFPIFFLFVVAQIAIFAIEFPIYHYAAYRAYFVTYWTAAALNLVLNFKIIHEIFLDIFRPYHALKDLGTTLFKWAALIMVLISAVLISSNPSWSDPVGHSILVLERCMRVIQCGLVLFLLVFCGHLGVSWKRHSFGIAFGFGFFAAVKLVSTALYSGDHLSASLADLANMVSFDFAICLWLVYAILYRREHSIAVLIPQRWDNALMDLHPQAEPESLIPMFEHMVDRAFSRTADRHAL